MSALLIAQQLPLFAAVAAVSAGEPAGNAAPAVTGTALQHEESQGAMVVEVIDGGPNVSIVVVRCAKGTARVSFDKRTARFCGSRTPGDCDGNPVADLVPAAQVACRLADPAASADGDADR